MKEKINRLAKGIIDAEVPQMICSPDTIDEAVRAGEVTKREVYITSENNLHIKGLVYSSNERVSVQNYAFGGLRNHITFEINSNHLEHGDIIKGSFYLVTNSGEKEIPYSFRVELGNSGKVLGGLETAEDFGRLAKNDWDTALRLFEYQDFIEAPFMQDISIRAVYDGLKGRVNRNNQLEEFLVFLKVKEPVKLEISDEKRFYDNLPEPMDDTIVIKKNTWGFAYMEARADGDFILFPQKVVTNADFTDNECRFSFRIQPARLHKGRNFGAIILKMFNDTVTIPLEVLGDETVEITGSDQEETVSKKDLEKYFSLRLDYESGAYTDALSVNRMLQELELVRALYRPDNLLNLMYAELLILSDNKEQACMILDECRESILTSRLENVENYCYYQYLNLLIRPNDSQKESLIRLLNKYLEERKLSYYLFFLLLKLDEGLAENSGVLVARMKKLYLRGCRSPLLYAKTCRILNENPEFLKNLEGLELQALHYGVKKELVTSDLALKTAHAANGAKHYNRILYRILVDLYKKFPEKELLGAICGILIRGGVRTEEAFSWYEKALEEKISLTRLYEYYLYSLPKDYSHALPREILLYFSYDNGLDDTNKSVLYQNILSYVNPDTAIYKDYEREIEKFAMNQLFSARINRRLAVIYDHMIYKDMIDKPVAKVLPAVLKSYRIWCRNPEMKYVVVCHEELLEEEAYSITDEVAYVPLFSENSHILFQDAYGNRYADVAYVKTPVMDKPDLEKRCFEVYPDHTMLLLKECGRILDIETPDEEQIQLLERLTGQLRLHPLYEKKILSKIVSYYAKMAAEAEDGAESGSYLLMMDLKVLTRRERVSVCETYIRQGYISEAYELIKEYGAEGISEKHLLKFCSKMILQKLFDQDQLLLHLSFRVFEAGYSDSVTMDYLCEHYNGTADQMYRVLKQGMIDHVETYDMEERLLAQMLFTDTMVKIDKVFDLYASRKKTSESILKAYFTVKSAEYFMQGAPSDDKVFSYLEGAVHGTLDKDKVPTIYLLALTKYYSNLPSLDGEQKKLCEAVMNIILSEGMIFAYFKDLAKHITIPEDIMDKGIIQYSGKKDSKVELRVRILPDEEEFHTEEMKRVYQGIFIKQKILFEGEIMEYQIYDSKDGARELVEEGSVSCDMAAFPKSDSRFACLNDMGLCLSLKEEESLKKKMQEYLVKNATAEELFSLM